MTSAVARLIKIKERAEAGEFRPGSRVILNVVAGFDIGKALGESEKDVRVLVKALGAVLALHQPDRPGVPEDAQCDGCLQVDPGAYVPYPCATVTTITAVLTTGETS